MHSGQAPGGMPVDTLVEALQGDRSRRPRGPRTQIIGADLIASFRGRRVVVLSPHFDDACFSLGTFLLRLGRGDLVNIFTRGDRLARLAGGAALAPNQVHAIRDAEDCAFANFCGLTRHDLGCEEPSLRGRRPGQLDMMEDDIRQMARPLTSKLEKLAMDGSGRGVLLAPLGVGRHVNHRATAMLALRFRGMIESRYDIYLYEDLPYACDPWQRWAALARARPYIAAGCRFVQLVEWPAKKALLEIYASQFKRRPASLRFRPATLGPRGPHEAFWSAPSLHCVEA